jgi:hypothetical protein
LFSSKKKHFADTQVVRVVEDDQVPDMMQSVMIETIIKGSKPSQALLNAGVQARFRKFERAYRFAEDGKYYYGLPDASIISNGDGYPLAAAQLRRDVGNVDIVYMHYRPLNNIFIGWYQASKKLGYHHKTNELKEISKNASAALNKPIKVYLDKFVANVSTVSASNLSSNQTTQAPEQSSFEMWEAPSSSGQTANRIDSTYSDVPLNNSSATYTGATDNSNGAYQTGNVQPVSSKEEIVFNTGDIETVTVYYTFVIPEEVPEKIPANADGTPVDPNDPRLPTMDDIENRPPIPEYVSQGSAEQAHARAIGEQITGSIVYNLNEFYAPNTEYPIEQEYYQAKWRRGTGESETFGYWLYNPANGTNRDLNSVFAPPEPGPGYTRPGTYFPFVVFRSGATNRADPRYKGTEEFDTTTEMCKLMGIDYESMGEEINDGEGIEDIRQAVMMQGIPMNSQNEGDIEYLWEHFWNIRKNLPQNLGFFESSATKPFWVEDLIPNSVVDPRTEPPEMVEQAEERVDENGIVFTPPPQEWIGDSEYVGGTYDSSLSATSIANPMSYALLIEDADFRMAVSFDDISVRMKAGRVTDVADPSYNPEFSNSYMTVDAEGMLYGIEGRPQGVDVRLCRVIKRQMVMPGYDGYVGGDPQDYRNYSQTYAKEKGGSYTGMYAEMIIVNPRFRYDVSSEVASPFGDANDDRLLIPIDYDVIRALNIQKREKLYMRGIHFVFNSHVIQKIKWYEKGWFKKLLIVVAIVIVIYSAGTAWQAAVIAAGAGATTAAIALIFVQTMLINFVVGYAISIGLKYVVKAVGGKIGQILAIAAAIYSMYRLGTNTTGPYGITGEELMQVSMGLSKGVEAETEREMKNLLGDSIEQAEMEESFTDALQAAQDDLDPKISIDLYGIRAVTPLSVFGENAGDFFERTIGNTNPGVAGLEICQNFVDTSLTLQTNDITMSF